jgi:glutamate synthase (ferredoxin)
MARLGFRTVDEMVGRVDRLEPERAVAHWKAAGIDLAPILYSPAVGPEVGRRCTRTQDHGLERSLDRTTLFDLCRPALERGEPVRARLPVRNVHRVVGTQLGSEVTRRYGADGLPEDTIRLSFHGAAGQSFGAFLPRGITLELEGEANDYFGKGLSGGRLILYPPAAARFDARENTIAGNVALYGATSGEAFIRGMAGERFAVRNSGATAVVEAVGDHGCEYMTGGRVVVLGSTGRNFAAGMSGGIAYVLDEGGDFAGHCNTETVDLEVLRDEKEAGLVRRLVERHAELTGSVWGRRVLADWEAVLPRFIKVMPRDYRRMLEAFARVEARGLAGEEAALAAFREGTAVASSPWSPC